MKEMVLSVTDQFTLPPVPGGVHTSNISGINVSTS